jgi:hypothetical protein
MSCHVNKWIRQQGRAVWFNCCWFWIYSSIYIALQNLIRLGRWVRIPISTATIFYLISCANEVKRRKNDRIIYFSSFEIFIHSSLKATLWQATMAAVSVLVWFDLMKLEYSYFLLPAQFLFGNRLQDLLKSLCFDFCKTDFNVFYRFSQCAINCNPLLFFEKLFKVTASFNCVSNNH